MRLLIQTAVASALLFAAQGAVTAQAQTGPRCQPYVIETFGKSAAASRKARERRAKRRAIRRWRRAVEGRLLGARGTAIPVAGTAYSNFSLARVESFNCSGRPLTCVLRAQPCRR